LTPPKVLVYDIEISKALYRTYPSRRPKYLSWKELESEQYLLGFAGKFLFEKKIYSCYVTPKEARERNGERVAKKLHDLVSKADVVVTYNGDSFDIRHMNTFWADHNLPPLHGIASVDLIKKVRQQFALPSYAMAYVAKRFKLSNQKGERNDTTLAELGDRRALKDDEKYCRQDVAVTEEMYMWARPWMKTHPNLAGMYELYHQLAPGESVCPRCLTGQPKDGWSDRYVMPSGHAYVSRRCDGCESIIRRSQPYTTLKNK
jgi:DNA polymerase elongation subunit (family B)